MKKSTVRILVVDDYEPWRRFVTSVLHGLPEAQIVGEASDGLAAIQKAEELQPDLILLDIGLPTLNGIEAGRRIRQLSPQSKILFMSEYSSPDIVKAALRIGAHGYLAKVDSGNELLPAVATILQDRKFASTRLGGQAFIDGLRERDADFFVPGNIAAAVEPENIEISRCHEVAFYADDASFANGFARFVKSNLRAGNSVVVIGTQQHRASVLARLRAETVDVATAIHRGSYLEADSVESLSRFMTGDMPDESRLTRIATELIMQAAAAGQGRDSRVAMCGELAPVLLAQGNVEGAIRVEQLFDNIVRTRHVDVLCGYLSSTFQPGQNYQAFERVCAEHSAVH